MEVLYLLIPLSVALAFLIGAAFWWSVASGQFEDLEGPAHRILLDDDGWPRAPNASRTVADAIDLHQDPGVSCRLTSAAGADAAGRTPPETHGPKERTG